ncbi:thiol:disulfide interchange protein DsbG [Acidithiobacillus caldus]
MQTKTVALAVGLLVVGALGGVFAGRYLPISAAKAAVVSQAEAQKLVDGLTHGQGQVEKTFAGPGGLTGALVQIDGHPNILYLTPDGKYLVAGTVFNAAGENLMREEAIQLGLISKPETPQALAKKAAAADSFVLGTKGPEITAFVDPNCIFCHKFYEEAKPLIAAGKLRVRFVVVAFLKPSSAGKAEAILGAKDPAAAMAENEKGFDEATEEGGIEPAKDPAAATVTAVQNNTKLLEQSGEVATPTLLYCNDHNTVVLKHGLPDKDLESFLKEIHSLDHGSCQGS